ncbi:hypothetical protein HPB49_007128 [Dermacentor silvarum]|uniref:Uncharacterized protein n=1 Tax=Dermacentor silvarum TaxID=543639 RepID=A0ACB8CJI9_DERSI|nr:hypothetical protein HPB49_007128 [Dermacentor silvarum]
MALWAKTDQDRQLLPAEIGAKIAMELTVQSRQTSKQNSRTHINGANTFKGDVPQPNFNGNEKYSTTRLYADIIGVENSYSVPLKPEGPRSSVTLEWKNVSYAVKQRKVQIKGPFDDTDMLPDYECSEKGYEGEVQVNGWIRDTELFNRQSCYVMQDDCLLPELTVRESLDMSIRLRMPSLQPAKRAHFVNNALSRWGLEDCHNTRAGQLSGGQRKRLSIAQEVVSNPPVIFLDEPTSGLDSSSALRCVSVMKSLASAGHTIICSIHNPSAKLFYYFDMVATHLRYAAYLAFAVMLIALFYGIGDEAARAINNLSLVILMLSILLFQSTMPTAMIFPTELSVLLRENRNCWYKPGMYYIARVLTEVPFMLLGPTAMVVAVYWATSQPAELWRLASVVLLCLQTCSTTQGLALVVSASTSAQTALFVALPAASPSFLFSGYFMPPKLLHPAVAWVTQLSHLHHALQGILYALYGSGRAELHCDEDTFCFFADPEQVLAETGAEDAWLPLKFCILLAMDAMYKTIAYVILRWRLRLKK